MFWWDSWLEKGVLNDKFSRLFWLVENNKTTVSETNHLWWGRTRRRGIDANVYWPGRRNTLRSVVHWYTLLWCRLEFQTCGNVIFTHLNVIQLIMLIITWHIWKILQHRNIKTSFGTRRHFSKSASLLEVFFRITFLQPIILCVYTYFRISNNNVGLGVVRTRALISCSCTTLFCSIWSLISHLLEFDTMNPTLIRVYLLQSGHLDGSSKQ